MMYFMSILLLEYPITLRVIIFYFLFFCFLKNTNLLSESNIALMCVGMKKSLHLAIGSSEFL